MDRRRFLQASSATLGYALNPVRAGWAVAPAPGLAAPGSAAQRGCLVHVDARLGRAGDALLERLWSAGTASPLLAALAGGKPILHLDAATADGPGGEQLAYNHVVLIGFADDPLLQLAWQREATIADGSVYAFGFGNLRGSIGYIESDRNPFLHAARIPTTPYETQLITITGTDGEGIGLAVEAFVTQGLCNGMVAKQGWRRPGATLLDCDPLPPGFQLPAVVPHSLGPLVRIAVTQASRDEYRGVLADAKVEPVSIWRAKYYQPGEWDAPGLIAAFHNYAVGLHRRAYGNTVWVATFATNAVAAGAAKGIAGAAKLTPDGLRWKGSMPAYAWGDAKQGDAATTGTLELWVEGESVLMAARTTLGSG